MALRRRRRTRHHRLGRHRPARTRPLGPLRRTARRTARAPPAPARPRRRRRLLVPAAVGAATAAALALRLAGGTVTADVRRHTVGYAVDLPYAPLLIAAYLVATVGALLLAADRALRTLGLLVAGGAVVCALLWNTAFVSTWCAVAAVASVTLLAWAVRRPPVAGPERRAAP
ncbi:DUF6629 family protein [Streptomyces sp. NPDC002835]